MIKPVIISFFMLTSHSCTSVPPVKQTVPAFNWFASDIIPAAKEESTHTSYRGNPTLLLHDLVNRPNLRNPIFEKMKDAENAATELLSENSEYYTVELRRTVLIPKIQRFTPGLIAYDRSSVFLNAEDIMLHKTNQPERMHFMDGHQYKTIYGGPRHDAFVKVLSNYKVKFFAGTKKVQYLAFWERNFFYQDPHDILLNVLDYDNKGRMISFYRWPPAKFEAPKDGSYEVPDVNPEFWKIDCRLDEEMFFEKFNWNKNGKIAEIIDTGISATTLDRYELDEQNLSFRMKKNRFYLQWTKSRYNIQ